MRQALFMWALVVAALATVSASAVAAPPAPDASTGSATNVGQSQATVTGTVNPHGSATTYKFQFGLTASYGTETVPNSAGSGTTAKAVSATLTGLQSGATYHYRLVATNASGKTTNGVDRTFTTQGAGASKLGLFGHTAFVGPSRIVGVFTGCFGVRFCNGSMKLTINGVVLGSRSSFVVRPNGGGIVHVTLNSEGRKRLARARGGHLRTRVTVKSDGGTDTKLVTIVPFK